MHLSSQPTWCVTNNCSQCLYSFAKNKFQFHKRTPCSLIIHVHTFLYTPFAWKVPLLVLALLWLLITTDFTCIQDDAVLIHVPSYCCYLNVCFRIKISFMFSLIVCIYMMLIIHHLQDVLENEDIKLDHMFKMSFLMDLSRVRLRCYD